MGGVKGGSWWTDSICKRDGGAVEINVTPLTQHCGSCFPEAEAIFLCTCEQILSMMCICACVCLHVL